MKPQAVKEFLIRLWARYKQQYGIKIYDFIIMDNHAHALVRAETTDMLGHFMRTVNSQLARFINKLFNRDSQAIRERYKSPLIADHNYFAATSQYIWLNRYKVNGECPRTDIFCSASWRLGTRNFLQFADKNDEVMKRLLRKLLDPYDDAPEEPHELRKYVDSLLERGLQRARELLKEVFEHKHTIGDELSKGFREQLAEAFRREKSEIPCQAVPPTAALLRARISNNPRSA